MTGLGVAALRAARPELLSAAARGIEEHRRTVTGGIETVLRGRSTALSDAGGSLSRWSGPASTAAAGRFSALAAELTHVGRDLAVCSQALSHAGLRLRSALGLLTRAEARAQERGARVTQAGVLVVPARVPRGDPVLDAHEVREDALMREEVTAYLRQAGRVATETDADLARHLVEAAGGCLAPGERGVLTSLPPPPVSGPGHPSADVFANAAWWRSLTSEERRQLVQERPESVGPRDGLPGADRDQANRILLDRVERAARGRLAVLEAGGEPLPEEVGAGGSAVLALGLSERAGALELVRGRLDALRAVRAVLGRQDGARRRLLLLDVAGRHPKAAVAIGEVDTAPHVATFVGGFTTTVGGDLDRYDRELARLRSSSSGMAHGDVAVVTWLGYAAPQADEVLTPSRTVMSSGVAARGGEELAAFVTGLDASREVPADQSVLAHSYGSVVLSFALRRPTGIDRAALFGSPGTGGAVRSVVDTGLKPGAFNVLGSIDDPVVAGGRVVLGPSAASVVGARTLSTYAPGAEGSPGARRTSRGHSDYLKAGSDSAFNLAAVVAGRGDATVAESAAERARKAWR
ncbi:alpha/beta hydrolase [Humibacillus xanthopallidus]|uniref:Alpha/beta hydrolase family protein n=1 Tax=Humibacillus xanthopallidus TaxID=412689 RepID=A0A543HJJ4_9MICO|nr:alpha/beta hydrolase [Humibacillus xanthopallidus]TQM58508.1 alpha/beta hydrolase family protein [Humibacillus xanthopallidus]